MNREAKKVRKSIMQRKKQRGILPKNNNQISKTVIPPIPQEEEKHGYYPTFFEGTNLGNPKSQFVSNLMLKGTLSILLFFGVGILWEVDAELLEKPKQWTSYALEEEFPFANIYAWYQTSFGSPMGVSPNQFHEVDTQPLALPVVGNVAESFQANGKGIRIAPDEPTPVTALREGVVIFAGNNKSTNQTVIVQHADGSKTTYGFLSDIDIHLYQIIQKNQRIGVFNPTENNQTVYFAIEKDNEFIDPVQVIEVDESP